MSDDSYQDSNDDQRSSEFESDPKMAKFEVKEGQEVRDSWGGKFDFFLSCIGYAVGLGNIWRFPYLCYQSGGGVFLIPYFTFLLLCGMPIVFMEVAVGQFASLSPIVIWKICPLLRGIGYCSVVVSGVVCIYYNVIIAWTLFYFIKSFSKTLPWSGCSNVWNTNHCTALGASEDELAAGFANGSSELFAGNWTEEASNVTAPKLTSSSEEYWRFQVLNLSSGIHDIHSLQQGLVICLVCAWILVFLCLCRGVRSSGKVVYVTATLPYIVLFILFFRGMLLPGAYEGVKFFLVPRWSKLLDASVWVNAAMQIFYSCGPAWGALITMASYNKFHHNCYKVSVLVPLINCATSLFSGLVIFIILGHMAHLTKVSVEKVISQGPGLIFVVYPETLSKLPLPQLWSVLFFTMILTVGLDTQFGMFETLVSAVVDLFPRIRRKFSVVVAASLAVLQFFAGLVCVTRGGIYVLQLMDWYSSPLPLMLISLCECVAIAWAYGVERFMTDIQMMVGRRPCRWWSICLKYITPLIIAVILLYTIFSHTPVTYGTYEYPGWAIGIGWIMAGFGIIPLPFFAIFEILRAKGSLRERVRLLLLPSPDYGPASEANFALYVASLEGERKQRATRLGCAGKEAEAFPV